ncbi:4Fe-4S dicluster domain-containing protein [Pelosinus sp. UFO1]|uniref:4Fe-4S dicluster domain-containing protein n=1 Tax=Pelosinus sp. UFO1 TaxID=484770 RepID=UPI0004D0E0F1|nr:epoxyqueuosine reductase [Pelosinus sp. UFO1]AIF52410.1 4Fe-4S ferredoxin, iron-sulpur binding domain-containing protein [Pelosinus sp. UFO1]
MSRLAQVELTKAEIIQEARDLGAEFVGFASIDRWIESGDVPVAFHPHKIWPQAKTVIVLGVPLWLPIIEASPTVLGREQAKVTNELLEKVAYRLAVFLNRKGHLAVIPDSEVEDELEEKPIAAFSHIWAGYYAGLGSLGWNHTLLTREYGPRVQLISIFTALELAGDPLVEGDLCNKCLYCQKICPAQALIGDEKLKYAQVDQAACINNEKRLQKAFSDPCGSCLKVCPVGEDRQLFQSNSFVKYFEEQDILARNPQAEAYRDWVHIRNYGSYPLEGALKKKEDKG